MRFITNLSYSVLQGPIDLLPLKEFNDSASRADFFLPAGEARSFERRPRGP